MYKAPFAEDHPAHTVKHYDNRDTIIPLYVDGVEKPLWQLQRYNERYAQSAKARIPLLMLPGFSCDGDIFEWIRPALAQDFVIVSANLLDMPDGLIFEEAIAILLEGFTQEISQAPVLMGWSFGGNCAIEFARQAKAKQLPIAGLMTFASTPQFTDSVHDNTGKLSVMDAQTYAKFDDGISHEKLWQKTLSRFDSLMTHGEKNLSEKDLKKSLQDYREAQHQGDAACVLQQENLIRTLKFLAEANQLADLQALVNDGMPCRMLFAENDALVNANIADELGAAIGKQNANFSASVIKNSSHLLMLSDADALFNQLARLKQQVAFTVEHIGEEKGKVAEAFSKAACSYDDSAAVQKQIAAELLDQLNAGYSAGLAGKTLLDAGCGTGFWSGRIKQQHLEAKVIGLDIADGMLTYAKAHHRQVDEWVLSDLENPLLPKQSVDVIFSSLAVQWCESLVNLLAHWYDLLKPGGQVFIATLSTQTLHELAASFEALDGQLHVNRFIGVDELKTQIERSPFKCMAINNHSKIIDYDHVLPLMKDLKNIGAQTVTAEQAKKTGLMSRAKLTQLNTNYQQFALSGGKLPATYDVVTIQLKKPDA